jgi:glycosyltransferase involved in cell wall biosynthesis
MRMARSLSKTCLPFSREAQISRPLVSIIIVVSRDMEELRQVIASILPHRDHGIEIVVIDGGSDDGTVELLQSLDDQVDYWLSEPDNGIYDAMNKGLKAATGEYVLHLNAGDRLRSIPWDELRKCAADSVDVVCCRVKIDESVEFISDTSLLSRIDNTWHHQGTFYRRVAHLGYDTTYRAGGDFDHNQRMMRAGCSVRTCSCVVADHRNNGITTQNTSHGEIYRSVRMNYGWPYFMLSKLRFTLRDLRDYLRSNFENLRR